ncbi:MAG: hypothetical protein A3F14_02125 [Gammaproteobacteria bacterium RIFCSPHIGHO2_12_FULL_43_28]|nr:MAG: hypothetical protein A3F14_02125 [Gammaproteobacteria bacterium RIFCSPHIGHO2_12_FULL_43_28]
MLKYIKPDLLEGQYKSFAKNVAVTKDNFSIKVENTLADMEWNHMDQLHRPYIHHTYEEAVRIALGKEFAVSLTRWKRLPIFITVSDIRIKPGLYYQIMTIAGLIFVHLVISMHEENEIVTLNIEWNIVSHKWLKLLHKPLSRKFFKLNTRLQEEDAQIRTRRYALRKKGYRFASDPVDYLSANLTMRNTIYPALPEAAVISLDPLPFNQLTKIELGENVFLLEKQQSGELLIWPSVCPHEGGDLSAGKVCKNNQIQCPWHGLRFSAVKLSHQSPAAENYGFSFELQGEKVLVRQHISVI